MFKVDKGIDVPKARVKHTYPHSLLDEVGDSVFIAGGNTTAIGTYGNKFGKANGKKFTNRKVTENGVVGVRVWRTE